MVANYPAVGYGDYTYSGPGGSWRGVGYQAAPSIIPEAPTPTAGGPTVDPRTPGFYGDFWRGGMQQGRNRSGHPGNLRFDDYRNMSNYLLNEGQQYFQQQGWDWDAYWRQQGVDPNMDWLMQGGLNQLGYQAPGFSQRQLMSSYPNIYNPARWQSRDNPERHPPGYGLTGDNAQLMPGWYPGISMAQLYGIS